MFRIRFTWNWNRISSTSLIYYETMREYEYVKSLASAFLVMCARGRVSTITLQSLKKVEKRKYIYSEIAIHCPLMINLNFHSGEQDFRSSSTAAYPIASPIIFPRVKFISQVLYFLFARVKRLSFNDRQDLPSCPLARSIAVTLWINICAPWLFNFSVLCKTFDCWQ